MEKYEIAVVGAGPSGSTAAYFLAQKNFDTVLLEKNVFPRDKPCGGGLTTKTIDFLKNLDFTMRAILRKRLTL